MVNETGNSAIYTPTCHDSGVDWQPAILCARNGKPTSPQLFGHVVGLPFHARYFHLLKRRPSAAVTIRHIEISNPYTEVGFHSNRGGFPQDLDKVVLIAAHGFAHMTRTFSHFS